MTKQDIIDTALREWGKTHFTRTNLKSVAEALGVTKTALYRYFDGKETLVRAILDQAVEDFNTLCAEFAQGAPYPSILDGLDCFFSSFFHHYFNNLEQFFFIMVYATWNRTESAHPYREGIDQVKTAITRTLTKGGKKQPSDPARGNIVSFMMITVFFWIIKSCIHSAPAKPAISQADIDNAVQFCRSGIGGGAKGAMPDTEELIRNCRVDPKELPENNKFFTAIAKTVSDYGMRNASMDKIAGQLSMKKSSLYFHFANKEKMMKSMFTEEQQTMEAIYRRHSRAFTAPWEKLVCYAFTLTSYLVNKPEMIITIGWMRMQANLFNKKQDHGKKIGQGAAYLREPLLSGDFVFHGLVPEEIIFLFNIHLTREIIHSFHAGMNNREIFEGIHRLCRLFHSGLEGADV